MSDILLLEPPSNMQKLQSIKTRKPQLGAPLPFIYMGSYLLDAGLTVDIIDLRIEPLYQLKDYLRYHKPMAVGITIMPGNALPRSIKLGKFIKKYSPGSKIIWGGSFPSLHHELCLSIPEVDFVVCGDGENTLSDLVGALKNSTDIAKLRKINGLTYRDNGSMVMTEPRTPVDLNSHPVGAWHLVDKYMPYYLGPRGYIAINTARGCPFKCSFCYNNLLYRGFKRYRMKDIDMVMAEIDYLSSNYEINKIQFMDDDFLGHCKRGLEMAGRINEKYPHMKYHIAARVDELKDEEIVRKLAETGCESVFLGVESASPKQLVEMHKGCSTNDTVETAKLCRKYKIRATYSFAFGFPSETKENLKSNVEMANILKDIDDQSQSIIEIISPIARTPLYDDLRAGNLLPEMSPAKWCYLSDWKSARQKPWIKSSGFYEAFQLAFYLAFSSKGHSSGLRSMVRYISRWSRNRLIDKNPSLLPEFRILNFVVKKALWGLTK